VHNPTHRLTWNVGDSGESRPRSEVGVIRNHDFADLLVREIVVGRDNDGTLPLSNPNIPSCM
jgi:hypothetical protein